MKIKKPSELQMKSKIIMMLVNDNKHLTYSSYRFTDTKQQQQRQPANSQQARVVSHATYMYEYKL